MTTEYPIEAKREIRELKKYLKQLASGVDIFLNGIDLLMRTQKSDVERGRAIAELCNGLDLENQMAKHFGLNIPFNKMNKVAV